MSSNSSLPPTIKVESVEEGEAANTTQVVPNLKAKDCTKLVRARFMQNPVYQNLVIARSLAWDSRTCYEARHYDQLLAEASKNPADEEASTEFFQSHLELAEEMSVLAKIFSFSGNPREPWMLDIGMAPGGFTTSFLKHHRSGHVFGITPHEREGGTKIVPRYNSKDERVNVYFGDLIAHPPSFQRKCDLAICNGEVFCVGASGLHTDPWRKWCFLHCQLIWAMKRLKQGGRLVVLTEDVEHWPTIELLNTLGQFATVVLLKSGRNHLMDGVFWIVANEVRSEDREAQEAIGRWTEMLNAALKVGPEGGPEGDAWIPQYNPEAISQFFDEFSVDYLKSAEPIWSAQAQVLYQGVAQDI